MNRAEAQRRADRIHAFREELAELEREGVLPLTPEQRSRLCGHHDQLLRSLSGGFDVDVTGGHKQLSWGMRIAAALGAAALSAALYFLFLRCWGYLAVPVQVAILVAAPLLALSAVELAARREPSGYFATIAALVAVVCFVLDLAMLGSIFDVTPSQTAFLVWAAFALLLAYRHGLRLVQIAGILLLLAYLTATAGTWHGCYWLSAGERPEHYLAGGLGVAALSLVPHRRAPEFQGAYRVFGLLAVFLAVLVLADWGSTSMLPLANDTVEHLYQVLGFLLAGAVIAAGVRFRWPGTTNLGSTFFAIFLYTKVYDWWWAWMPRYLFFLVVGLIAILLLLVLKRLRAATREVTA